MGQPSNKYTIEVYEDNGGDQLAKWESDAPFGSIAVGDTLDPSSWYIPHKDCLFRVKTINHMIHHVDDDFDIEVVHEIRLYCAKEVIEPASGEGIL